MLSEAATEGTPLYVEKRFEARFEETCVVENVSAELDESRKPLVTESQRSARLQGHQSKGPATYAGSHYWPCRFKRPYHDVGGLLRTGNVVWVESPWMVSTRDGKTTRTLEDCVWPDATRANNSGLRHKHCGRGEL